MLRLTQSNWLKTAELTVTIEMQLALLLARPILSSKQKLCAIELASQVQDWPAFYQICATKFVLPLCQGHLSDLKIQAGPPGLQSAAKQATIQVAMSALRIANAQKKFHQNCVIPAGGLCLYMKGATLAQEYYGQFGLRKCRDIDVYIPYPWCERVLDLALSLGYRILLDPNLGVFAERPEEIEFAREYLDVISLVGSDGVHIELHRKIETATGIFDDVLFKTKPAHVIINSTRFPTLPPEWLFCYISLHHSRHFWSHLHWIADIVAISTHPNFNYERARAIANDLGILGTVDASLELADISGRPDLWHNEIPATRGGQFLKLCLLNLSSGLEVEAQISKHSILGQFCNSWQISPSLLRRAFLRWLRKGLRPNLIQHKRYQLPKPIHGIYRIENFMRIVVTLLNSILTRWNEKFHQAAE